jgi:gamma-glutamyltranspeptidase/glutathione hydrolase
MTTSTRRIFAGCLALLPALLLVAAPAPARDGKALAQAGIATAHPLATAAGQEMLAAGGNAFDAAVAISATLAVVEPFASGLGGGAFWLLHEAKSGRQVFVDAREVAPGAATPGMYLDAAGNPVPGSTLTGPLAAGIPGQPAGLVHLAKHYGKLPLERLLAPAIRHAEQGVAVTRGMALGLQFRQSAARQSPEFAARFYPGGRPLAEGDRLRQPELAATLRRLARHGFDGYYRGETARLLVAGVRAGGGIWTLDDLAGYRVIEREPVRAVVDGVTVISAPPPSAGGIALVNMLNMLSGFDRAALDSATQAHLNIEVLRRAFRDRAMLLGDPAFVAIPMARLLSPAYAAGQATTIRLDRATPSAALAGPAHTVAGGPQTTHFSIIDRAGNRVAGTLSINTFYGAAFIPPGTGVILNNQMDDFVIKPGVANGFDLVGAEANAIAPGKRMLSSMAPTFLESPRGVAVLGTPGGSRIISMMLLATLAWIDGAEAPAMVALKRYHHQYQPDVVAFETGAFSEAEQAALRGLGHRLEPSPRPYGNMQVVTWDRASGKVEAASDPRGGGDVLVY